MDAGRVVAAGEGRDLRWRGGLLAGLVGWSVVGCAAQDEAQVPVRPSDSAGLAVTATATPPITAVPPVEVALTEAPVPTVTQESVLEPGKGVNTVTFSIVYDNNRVDPALQTEWGFACLVETDEATVLFDTGGSSQTLLGNMERMSIDPQAIDAVVLSHQHGDHVDGLAGLLELGVTPPVYVPAEFSVSFKDRVRTSTELIEVSTPTEVFPGIHATGRVGSGIVEQALAVETADGLVVVTGCAHPGVVAMVRRAKEVVPGEVALVMGGFHLGNAGVGEVEDIVTSFRRLDVRQVAPCHCTGSRAREVFAEAYGQDCFMAGVGWKMSVESEE